MFKLQYALVLQVTENCYGTNALNGYLMDNWFVTNVQPLGSVNGCLFALVILEKNEEF